MFLCFSLVTRGMFRANLQQCASGATIYLSHILSLEQKHIVNEWAPFWHNSITKSQNSCVGEKIPGDCQALPSLPQFKGWPAGGVYSWVWVSSRTEIGASLYLICFRVWPFLIFFLIYLTQNVLSFILCPLFIVLSLDITEKT